MRFDWAQNPLAQLTTSQYSFEQFITSLNESIQLQNELSRAQAIGVGYGQYTTHPADVPNRHEFVNYSLCSYEGCAGMSENCAVKLRNFTSSEQVDAQVEQHKRNRTCINQDEKEFLPRNGTHLCQRLDSFIIQKLTYL